MIEDFLPHKTPITPSSGTLLISAPLLKDKYFERSVVLLTHHSPEESVGYILNQQHPKSMSQLLQTYLPIDFPIYIGGPVSPDSLHVIHHIPHLLQGQLFHSDLYWNGDVLNAIELLKNGILPANSCKFFFGYSGWSPGQLEAEIDMFTWLVSNPTSAHIMENNIHDLWAKSIELLGPQFKNLLHIPQNPILN